MIKRWAGPLVAAVLLMAAGCSGGGGTGGGESAASVSDPAKVSGDITVLTNRTDLVNDGTMDKYAAEFTKIYPKVHVTFQGITDYEGEVKIRMNTTSYGDVLLIPAALKRDDYHTFFASLGTASEMSQKYRFIPNFAVGGQVYGLAQNGNANGFVYNTAVWKQAGIDKWATTPEAFVADLQAIKSKTSAVPYYTNYHDGWPLSSWQSALGSVTCDPKANDELATDSAPWSAGREMYAIDTLLYTVVHDKLIEADPTTTNWEGSKGLIATGKIATMWLGSWAVTQMRDAAKKAGTDPEQIGFMPWPVQVGGHFCSVVGPDYGQAVSIHSAHKAAARAWIDWFTDKSTYAQDNADVPTLKTAALPDSLKPYQDAGVEFVELTQDKAAAVNNIDNESEVGLTKQDYRQHIVDVARGTAGGDLQKVFDDLNKRWGAAVKTAGG
jgi:raffinose/stachyose/melibiose transport system substrate-binding protein